MTDVTPAMVVDVVAAVRRRRQVPREVPPSYEYWVCRRTDDGKHGGVAGMWEYPGGKVEEGETLEAALWREMYEEFGVRIEINGRLDTVICDAPDYSDNIYRVHFFYVRFRTPPTLRCHDRQKWCTPQQLQLDRHLPSGTIFNQRLLNIVNLPTTDRTLIDAVERLVKRVEHLFQGESAEARLVEVTLDLNDRIRWLEECLEDRLDAMRYVRALLCGRLGGCLGETCGCVKGTLDGQPLSETRRKAGWDRLNNFLEKLSDG